MQVSDDMKEAMRGHFVFCEEHDEPLVIGRGGAVCPVDGATHSLD